MSNVEFDPRHAALNYAGEVERRIHERKQVAAQADSVHAVVCGLVYVGDQLQRIANALERGNDGRD